MSVASPAAPLTAITSPHVDRQTQLGSKAVIRQDPEALAEIYNDNTNIVVWQRQFSEQFENTVSEFVASRAAPYISSILSPSEAPALLRKKMGGALADDVAELVDMFCCLFELQQAGLRMTVLRDTMCPKFHVDHVPCRLVTTYTGIATEWLPHHLVNRDKLGINSEGKADQESGLYQHETDIQRLASGEVALLKGEGWLGNQNAGLVHRSPAIAAGNSRLLLTLDFSS